MWSSVNQMSSKKVPLQVTLVGAGGLGAPFVWGLAEAWKQIVSTQSTIPTLIIHIIDSDVIERSNLNRQVLFRDNDIGQQKSNVLAETIAHTYRKLPISIEHSAERITRSNTHLLKESSVIVDCTDSTETKFLLNDYAIENQIPFCYGGAVMREGLVILSPNSDPNLHCGCLRCLFGDFTDDDYHQTGVTCSRAGILGPVAGVIGFLQAEAVTALIISQLPGSEAVSFEENQSELWRFSVRDFKIRRSRLNPDIECPHQKSVVLESRNSDPKFIVPPAKGVPQTKLSEVNCKTLDLRTESCPMTYLYTKLALEQLNSGNRLKILLDTDEQAQNVYSSTQVEGHLPTHPPEERADGGWELEFIRK